MTLNNTLNMDDLTVGSLWKGHHTKYTYEVLCWDGDYENGGMAFVKRTKKKNGYDEFKLVNIVDLLSAYDKLPSAPEVNETWENPYGAMWIVRELLTDSEGNTWVAYSEEGVAHVEEFNAMELVNFLMTFTRFT
jgi:hypothetical protein